MLFNKITQGTMLEQSTALKKKKNPNKECNGYFCFLRKGNYKQMTAEGFRERRCRDQHAEGGMTRVVMQGQ